MAASHSPQASLARPRTSRSSPAVRGSDIFPIVGIGASAGGLEACQKFLTALPDSTGMAFILVQHLDPTHESMMVDLLSVHTSMRVLQAIDGLEIEKEHFYIIPPASYLSVADGKLRLSLPKARHGARLPFDHLLTSLAEDCGQHAVCVVLSGNGADGSLGLRAVKKNLGLVIAQTPEEASYDGMPRSAILTGAVDLVLDVGDIPQALITYERGMASLQAQGGGQTSDDARKYVPEIVDLLRTKTPLDFRAYKQGTLQRRIERRMAMAAIETPGMARYLDVLRDDGGEVEQLAKDLLINVTSFFRDPGVFEFLAQNIIPDLVRSHGRDDPLRLWIAGCSTGEETYSLAMLFREEITAQKRNVKLQLFASDVAPEAIAVARDGFYPDTIEADVSAARLARFFNREEHGYRIQSDLRATVVFAVQDVLADPPFSRLDFISCRNLLIYLRPEAQAKVISLFHFALCDGGILLLGSAETVGSGESHFKTISRPEKIYRHVGRSRPGEIGLAFNTQGSSRLPARPGDLQSPSRRISLAGLARRLMLENYAPVAVLINRNLECLHSLGPTERYLRVPPGPPTHDLLAMVLPELRGRLKAALQLAWHQTRRMSVDIGHVIDQGGALLLHIDLLPVVGETEELMLVCFQNRPGSEADPDRPLPPADGSRVAELERNLAESRTELQSALHYIEMSGEEHKAINEEALSVNEEYQSANEELLTSKEELQSLNEELTALNAQLQETLEKQRTTANDLQNVLYSTDVATLFLDTELRIRFFTPATKFLFNVIPGDIGRPLADLNSVAADARLLEDARTVLQTHGAIEREIEAADGACFVRRILPYRTQVNGVEGVVITFIDITDRRYTAHALETAKLQAEQANLAKSRFLAAASHDLRQPMQTLTLIQGFLARDVLSEQAAKRVVQLGDALSAMAGMLNTLLDINEIEAGTIHARPVEFSIKDLLLRLQDEFAYQAAAQGLELRAVTSDLRITSDPRLLEQILRNLLANALKYTKKGRVLFGCRRRRGLLVVEIWDTGIGIADEELLAIFDEFHQIDNAARERSRGLGLGLSIVRRLARLLGHHVTVRSWPGKGSVFSVAIKTTPAKDSASLAGTDRPGIEEARGGAKRLGAVLVVEDDPDLRELLEAALTQEGHFTLAAPDSVTAMALLASDAIHPDLLLADFNLPNGMNGLQLASLVRTKMAWNVPTIILTGDISNPTTHEVARQNCLAISKPAKLGDVTGAVQRLMLDEPAIRTARPRAGTAPTVFVVDDDSHLRAGIRTLLEEEGHTVEDFSSCEAFLAAFYPGREGCLLIDAYLPGMKGLELLKRLKEMDRHLPAIMITGNSDVATAVEAMKSGAYDFLDKPFDRLDLLARIDSALERSRGEIKRGDQEAEAANRIASLTRRQRQIMEMILVGHPNKNIASDLAISQRTVEHHRAAIMEKTGSKSLPALARLAALAEQAKTS